MKKQSIGKLTQKKVNEIEFKKPGQPEVGYYGEDKRILAVPTQTGISIVVKINCNNKRYSFKVGDLRDHKLAELLKRAHDFIADIVNTRYHIRPTKTVMSAYEEIIKPYSLAHHEDSSGFQQRLASFITEFGHIPVSNIKKSDIQKVLNNVAKGRQTSTVSRYHAAYSKFFSLCIDHELIDINPCSKIKKPPENPCVKRYLSDAEVIAFIEGCFIDQNPIHAYCLLLSLLTGQRQGNMRSIELSWFNKNFTVLNIPDSKSGQPICHQLSPITTEVVKLALPNSDGIYLFPSRVAGKFMSKPTRCMARIRGYVQETTGITDHFYAHMLRKNFATTQLSVTGDLNIVRENLAHSDIKTTLIYAFNQNEKLRDANTKTAKMLLGGRSLSSFIKNC
jgi:site-specific recombinase XerD